MGARAFVAAFMLVAGCTPFLASDPDPAEGGVRSSPSASTSPTASNGLPRAPSLTTLAKRPDCLVGAENAGGATSSVGGALPMCDALNVLTVDGSNAGFLPTQGTTPIGTTPVAACIPITLGQPVHTIVVHGQTTAAACAGTPCTACTPAPKFAIFAGADQASVTLVAELTFTPNQTYYAIDLGGETAQEVIGCSEPGTGEGTRVNGVYDELGLLVDFIGGMCNL